MLRGDSAVLGSARGESALGGTPNVPALLEVLRRKILRERPSKKDVQSMMATVAQIIEPQRLTETALGAIRMIGGVAEKWSSLHRNRTVLQDCSTAGSFIFTLFRLLCEPTYGAAHDEIVKSLLKLLFWLSTDDLYGVRLVLGDCCDLLLDLSRVGRWAQAALANEEGKSRPRGGLGGVSVAALASYQAHLARNALASGYTPPPPLVLDVADPERRSVLQKLTTRLCGLIISRMSLFGLDCTADLFDVCLHQLVSGSPELRADSLDALRFLISASASCSACPGFALRKIFGLLHDCVDESKPSSSTTPRPQSALSRFPTALASMLECVRECVDAQRFQPYVGDLSGAIPGVLARSQCTELKVEVLRLFGHLVPHYPHIAEQVRVLLPYLNSPAMKPSVIECLRLAHGQLVRGRVAMRRLRAVPPRASGGSSSTAQPSKRASPVRADPRSSPMASRGKRRRTAKRISQPHSGSRLHGVQGLGAGTRGQGVGSDTTGALAKIFKSLEDTAMIKPTSSGSFSPRSLIQSINDLDSALQVFLPLGKDKENAGVKKLLGRLLKRLEESIELVHSLETKPKFVSTLPRVILVLVDLVKEVFRHLPNHILVPIMDRIVGLISIPWGKSVILFRKHRKGREDTKRRWPSLGSEFSVKLKRACLELLGVAKMTCNASEKRILEQALLDCEEIRCASIALVPSFLARIPTANGERSQAALNWFQQLQTMMKNASSSERRAILKATGGLLCICGNPDLTRERILRGPGKIACALCDHPLRDRAEGRTSETCVKFGHCQNFIEYLALGCDPDVRACAADGAFRAFQHLSDAGIRRHRKLIRRVCLDLATDPSKVVRNIASARIPRLASTQGGTFVEIFGPDFESKGLRPDENKVSGVSDWDRKFESALDAFLTGIDKRVAATSDDHDGGSPSQEQDLTHTYSHHILVTVTTVAGLIGRIAQLGSKTQFRAIKLLVEFMLHENFDVRALAYDQLNLMAKENEFDTRELLNIHRDRLHLFLIESLPQKPTIVIEVCEALLGVSDLKIFLNDALRNPKVVAPLIIRQSESALEKVRRICGFKTLHDLVREYLHKILSEILLYDEEQMECSLDFLRVTIGIEEKTLPDLIKWCLADLVVELVLKLGDETESKLAEVALYSAMAKLSGDASRAPVGSGNRAKIADFLARHFMQCFDIIVSRVDAGLKKQRGKSEALQRAVRSLRGLIRLTGPRTYSFIYKVMTTLKIFTENEHTRPHVAVVWMDVVTALTTKDLGMCLGQIVTRLVPFLEYDDARETVLRVLRYLIIERRQDLKQSFRGIPCLNSEDEDLKDINDVILEEVKSSSFEEKLKQCVRLMEHESVNVRLCAILAISATVRQNPQGLEALMQNTNPEGLICKLLSSLLLSATDSNLQIRIECCKCIGELGALDPGVFTVNVQLPKSRFTKNDELARHLIEKKLMKSIRAAPSHKEVNKTLYAIQELLKCCGCGPNTIEHHRAYWESKFKGDAEQMRGVRNWDLISLEIRKLISPCLTSDYDYLFKKSPGVGIGATTAQNEPPSSQPLMSQAVHHTRRGDAGRSREGPAATAVDKGAAPARRAGLELSSQPARTFYRAGITLREWLGDWTKHLMSRTDGPRAMVLKACTGVVKRDVDIAKFLLPYLVENVLETNTDVNAQSIVQELLAVVESAADAECLQAVFELLDQIRYWARPPPLPERTRRNKRSSRSRSRSRSELQTPPPSVLQAKILDEIPTSKLGRAAFKCKAYARALKYYELHLRTESDRTGEEVRGDAEGLPSMRGTTLSVSSDEGYDGVIGGAVSVEALQPLQLIYARLDEPDGMDGIASLRSVNPIREQIRDYESKAQWAEALTCYEQELQFSSTSWCHLGIVKCQLKLGNLRQALTHVQGAMNEPKRPDLKSLAGYGIAAAWRLCDWKLVDRLLNAMQYRKRSRRTAGGRIQSLTGLPEADFEIALGRILSLMHEDSEGSQLQEQFRRTRLEILQNFSAASQESYQRAYPYCVRLHVLKDLESMYTVLHGIGLSERVSKKQGAALRKRWEKHSQHWEKRLKGIQPSFRYRELLLSARRVLCTAFLHRARDDVDKAWLREAMGSCWLTVAEEARGAKQFEYATGALLQAKRKGVMTTEVERAKLLKSKGEMHRALMELEDAQKKASAVIPQVNSLSLPQESKADKLRKAELYMLIGEWTEECGAKNADYVTRCFSKALTLVPNWEKAQFAMGRFKDGLMQAVEKKNPGALLQQMSELLPSTIEYYGNSLISGHQFIFQSLPRLLTLWFDFMEEHADKGARRSSSSKRRRSRTSAHGGRAAPAASARADAEAEAIHSVVRRTTQYMMLLAGQLTAYQWYTALPQIISRLGLENRSAFMFIREIVANVIKGYPQQALWAFAATYFSTNDTRRRKASDILKFALEKVGGRSATTLILNQSIKVFNALKDVCLSGKKEDMKRKLARLKKSPKPHKIQLTRYFPALARLRSIKVLVPIQANLTAVLPANGQTDPNHDAFPGVSVNIEKFENQIEVMHSKEQPLKLKILGSDGNLYSFLCKSELRGDMRKNSRLMEFNTVINRLLQKTPDARKRKLRLRTFAVLPMREDCGLIEWVNNTTTYRNVISSIHRGHGIDPGIGAAVKYKKQLEEKYPGERNKVFVFQMLQRRFPAMLHKWFYSKFPEPTSWFENRLRYSRSVAAWSMAGYVVGLGDRHGENILLDQRNGECVHVDFDCLFDKGRTLDVPERVPFRLTQNIVDGFGITGYAGVFEKSCDQVLRVMRRNRDVLMSVLHSFVHDPLVEWEGKTGPRISAMNRIRARLSGQISDDNIELPLSVPGQVHQLIEDATSPQNLAKMYVGWQPWL